LALAGLTGIAVGNSVAPTTVVTTTGTPTAAAPLINGVSVDSVVPIDAFTIVTNVAVTPADPAVAITAIHGLVPDPFSAGGIGISVTAFAAASATATLGTPVAATATKAPTFKNTVAFLPAAVWTTGTAADHLVFGTSPIALNTGITGVSLPITMAAGTTPPKYTQVFNVADGLATTFTVPSGGTATDGVPAILVSVADKGTAGATTKLDLKFSEAMAVIAGGIPADDLREIAENVKIGADSLASLNLNAGGVLSTAIANANGQGVLSISGIRDADIPAASPVLSISKGISAKESNDATFSATVDAIEAFDGLTNLVGGELVAAATNVPITAPPLTLAFTDATAAAITTDGVKVSSVVVSFPTGKEVKLDTVGPKTAADLANDLLVTINGVTGLPGGGVVPAVFTFHPSATEAVLNVAGNLLTITLPTALIYAKIDTAATINVEYNTGRVGGNALVSVSTTPNQATVTTGALIASLPLTALATTSTLMTQSIRGTMSSSATDGSLIKAYLAKWRENPGTSSSNTVTITGGTVSRPGDQLLSNLALQFNSAPNGASVTAIGTGLLAGLIKAQLDAAVTAQPAIPGVRNAEPAAPGKPITVYATMTRSNDTRANANGTTNVNGDNLQAQVWLSTTMDAAVTARTFNSDPIYELTLDPNTGNLKGQLNGKVNFSAKKGSTNAGLTLLNNGNPVAQSLVTASKFDLLAGVDGVDTTDLSQGLKAFSDQFLILVLQDPTQPAAEGKQFTQLTSANPGRVNYLPFEPNLASLKGTRTVLGVAPGIAGPVTGTAAPANIDLTKYKKGRVDQTSQAWRIGTSINPANVAIAPPGASFARNRVGLDDTGVPVSAWTGDGAGTDMAMRMTNSKVFLATELGDNKGTLSTITGATATPGAVATAFKSDGVPNIPVSIATAQGNPVSSVKVGPGWSLVAAPAATLNATTVDAIIRVGAQAASQFTWLKADGPQPALTVGEGVFVFSSKLGGGPLQ
jgi:hypothetical protein